MAAAAKISGENESAGNIEWRSVIMALAKAISAISWRRSSAKNGGVSKAKKAWRNGKRRIVAAHLANHWRQPRRNNNGGENGGGSQPAKWRHRK